MNDQEKSEVLAKARGWRTNLHGLAGDLFIEPDEPTKELTGIQFAFSGNFYDPVNAALAWRIHIWALSAAPIKAKYFRWWKLGKGGTVWLEEDAQRMWLDKILALLSAKGLVVA